MKNLIVSFRKNLLLTVSSISTRFLGAAGFADRLFSSALLEAFLMWVDFLAFPAIFSVNQFYWKIEKCNSLLLKLKCDSFTNVNWAVIGGWGE